MSEFWRIYIILSCSFGLIHGMGTTLYMFKKNNKLQIFSYDDNNSSYLIIGFYGLIIYLLAFVLTALLMPVVILGPYLEKIIDKFKERKGN